MALHRSTSWLPQRALAVVVAAMTLAAGASAVAPPAAEAQAAEAQVRSPLDLPLLPTARAVPPRLEIPAGDYTNPPPNPSSPEALLPVARSTPSFDPGRSRPLDAETTATKKVYANGDGTRTAVLSAGPVRFKDSAGRWTDVDLALTPRPDGLLVAKAAPGATSRLSPKADGPVAAVDTAAGTVSLRHPGANASRAEVAGTTATYKGALGRRDLVLSLTTNGFEETVIVPDAAAGMGYVDELVLPAGVSARQAGSGVELLDRTGAVVATFGGGLAFDAAKKAGSVTPVSLRLTGTTAAQTADGSSVAAVEVGVDPAWASAPERAFPVRIDPVFTKRTTDTGGVDTTVDNLEYADTRMDTSAWMTVGSWDGVHTGRALMSFDLGSLPNPSTVVSAAKSRSTTTPPSPAPLAASVSPAWQRRGARR